MKTGLLVSTAIHGVALTWGLWALGAPDPMVLPDDSLPVDIVSVQEFSQMMRGAEDAPLAETSAVEPTDDSEQPVPDAQNAGQNTVDLDAAPAPRAAPRETIQTAAAEAQPEPVPVPAPIPEPEPQPAPEPEPLPEPVPEAAPETPAEAPPETVEEAETQAEAPPEPAQPRNVPIPGVKPAPPRPVEVAEVKPKPEPKREEKKPEEPKREPPKQQATDEKQFDADKIAALLNTEKSAGGGAKREQQTAALGGRETNASSLSASEIDALRQATKACWYEPSGSFGSEGIVIEVSFELDPDGSLQALPRATASGGDPATRKAYEDSAVRAVRICAQQGRYRLSSATYDAWSELTFNFRPGDTY